MKKHILAVCSIVAMSGSEPRGAAAADPDAADPADAAEPAGAAAARSDHRAAHAEPDVAAPDHTESADAGDP